MSDLFRLVHQTEKGQTCHHLNIVWQLHAGTKSHETFLCMKGKR